jgi:hypothetical protein
MKRSEFRFSAILVLSLGVAGVGCGGKGGEDSNHISYTLPSTTKVVDSKNEGAVLSVSPNAETIVLDPSSDTARSISEGDVLLSTITSKTPNGLLRKVVSKTVQADTVVLNTKQATLEEAFQDLDLKITRKVSPSSMQTWTPRVSGLTVVRSPLTVEGTAEEGYELNFDDTVLWDADGDPSTKYDQVVLNGSAKFTLALEMEVQIEWFNLKEVRFGATVEHQGELEASTTLPELKFEKEITVATLYFAPFAIGPVVVAPILEFVVGANGKLEAKVTAGISEELAVSGGIDCVDRNCGTYKEFTANFNYTPPTLTASANLRAFAGPRLNMTIYGVAGPYVNVNGYGELNADINANPWWELAVGIEGFAGVKGEILSVELFNYETDDFIGYKKVIADAGGPFNPSSGCPDAKDCTGRACGPDPVCSESCGQCEQGYVCNEDGKCVYSPSCGNGQCDLGETYCNCPSDCQIQCGDGCCSTGETLQNCPADCECVPDCTGKECGDDGCGGSCGTCGTNETCQNFQCVGCIPNCAGKECGDDGCGGSCGQCGPNEVCTSDGVCSTVSGGSEFQVNTRGTYDQRYPSITSLSNGGFVVVWESNGQDGSSYGVYGQRFGSNGTKVGSEFQVNTWTTDYQEYPSITSLPNGGFVVVWHSYGQDGSYSGVYGQRFDSDGNKVGSEFQVNTWTTDYQEYPSITSLPDGGFVVVWESLRQDGSGYGIYGQRFDPNGNKVGSEFQVNTWTTDEQWYPSITSLSNGGFVVVWESDGQDGSDYGVYGQRFDSNGNKVGSEFRVNTWTTDDQEFPSITSLSNGGFVVVWESDGQDGYWDGVYGQRFDSNGNKLGSEFQVNTWTTNDQMSPSITSLSNGGFVVVWESGCLVGGCDGQDGSSWGVYGQRFDSNGNKVGSEFQVNTWTTDYQGVPSITSLSNGGFVVVWESGGQDGYWDGVYGQRFDANGNKVGSEFQVNTWTTNDQQYPSITSLSNGGFVLVWQSNGQDADGYGVYGQRFDTNGNKVGSEFRVNTWTTGEQSKPSITSLPNGGFVVVWSGEGQGDYDGVYGQRFDSNGNKVGSEFQVNTWTTNAQWWPSITSLSNGGFVVVWHSNGQDGSDCGVYGRIFSQ